MGGPAAAGCQEPRGRAFFDFHFHWKVLSFRHLISKHVKTAAPGYLPYCICPGQRMREHRDPAGRPAHGPDGSVPHHCIRDNDPDPDADIKILL